MKTVEISRSVIAAWERAGKAFLDTMIKGYRDNGFEIRVVN